eukprot:3104237-Rhodomonas_salina.1
MLHLASYFGYAPTVSSYALATPYPVLKSAMLLQGVYTMPGTNPATARLLTYDMSGTNCGEAATRLVLNSGMLLQLLLRHIRHVHLVRSLLLIGAAVDPARLTPLSAYAAARPCPYAALLPTDPPPTSYGSSSYLLRTLLLPPTDPPPTSYEPSSYLLRTLLLPPTDLLSRAGSTPLQMAVAAQKMDVAELLLTRQ